MSDPKAKAPAVETIADLEAKLAALKGQAAVEGFSKDIEAAEKAGFKAVIAPAHNGGQPALRVDY